MDKSERKRTEAIIAHNIAAQAAAIEGGTYHEAFRILDHAKSILENNMRRQKAEVPEEIRDYWGVIIEVPQADTQGKKEEISQ